MTDEGADPAGTQLQIAHQPACAKPISKICITIRMEGKHGVKRVRILYDLAVDSYDSFIDAILERYLPETEKPFVADDFAVELRDIVDKDWPVDIENSQDLELAIDSPLAKTNGPTKMCAHIRLKSDPSPIVVNQVEAASVVPTDVADGNDSVTASAEKRRIVTPTRKHPAKRCKSVKGPGVAGGKLSVRARIIGSIAELHALGKPNPPRIQVAIFTGYSNASSKSFANALSALKTEGIVAYPDNKSVSLTPKGLETAEARAISPPANDAEVHLRIKALLTPTQQQIFDLLAADPRVWKREEVAAAVGYSNVATKSFSNSISKMSSIGLVHYPKSGTDPKSKYVQITSMCFPFLSLQADEIASSSYQASTPPLPATEGEGANVNANVNVLFV